MAERKRWWQNQYLAPSITLRQQRCGLSHRPLTFCIWLLPTWNHAQYSLCCMLYALYVYNICVPIPILTQKLEWLCTRALSIQNTYNRRKKTEYARVWRAIKRTALSRTVRSDGVTSCLDDECCLESRISFLMIIILFFVYLWFCWWSNCSLGINTRYSCFSHFSRCFTWKYIDKSEYRECKWEPKKKLTQQNVYFMSCGNLTRATVPHFHSVSTNILFNQSNP